MKKKIVSLVLALALTLSLCTPAFAAPTYNDDYSMSLPGVEETVGGQSVVTFSMKAKGPQLGTTAGLLLKIDATKLRLCLYDDAGNVTIPGDPGDVITDPGFASIAEFPNFITDMELYGKEDIGVLYLLVSPVFKGQITSAAAAEVSLGTFRLALQSGVTMDDLDKNSVVVASRDMADDFAQNASASLSNGDSFSVWYNGTAAQGGPDADTLREPVVSYPGSDKTPPLQL